VLVEVIVVDDGSSDATAGVAGQTGVLGGRLRVHPLGRHRGKGAAVRAGVLEANGDWVLIADVDLSAPLAELTVLAAAVRGGADVAMGSRALTGSRLLIRQPWYRERMGKAFNVALRLLTGLPYRDTQCGFKLVRRAATRRVFEAARIDGFAFDAELCVLARRHGLQVAEVPVSWSNHPDTHVGLVRGSVPMALDLVRLTWWSRRPVRRGGDAAG
jgi:dolichyl-phosphate beta-glucosyltransferase